MVIQDSFIYLGKTLGLEYRDADSFDDLPRDKVTQAYGLCFCDGKLVIGFGGNKKDWGLIGGTIEKGETYRETLDREIQEESNMQVIDAKPVGYQIVTDEIGREIYQLRYWCKVEAYGPFTADPAGGVKEIKLIDPTTYKEYFDWGRIGDRLVERSIEIERLSHS